MSTYPLANFEIQKFCQNEPKFNGICSRKYSPKIKDEGYVMNLYEFKSIGNNLIDFYVNGNNIIHFDSFGVGHIPKDIHKFIGNKNIITNVYGIQEYDSIICG